MTGQCVVQYTDFALKSSSTELLLISFCLLEFGLDSGMHSMPYVARIDATRQLAVELSVLLMVRRNPWQLISQGSQPWPARLFDDLGTLSVLKSSLRRLVFTLDLRHNRPYVG